MQLFSAAEEQTNICTLATGSLSFYKKSCLLPAAESASTPPAPPLVRTATKDPTLKVSSARHPILGPCWQALGRSLLASLLLGLC